MVHCCAVYGCKELAIKGSSYKFYRFPQPGKNRLNIALAEIKLRRRSAWYKALRRADITESQLSSRRICSKHFISGVPADDVDETNPDWIPSLNLGHSKSISPRFAKLKYGRWKRSEERAKKSSTSPLNQEIRRECLNNAEKFVCKSPRKRKHCGKRALDLSWCVYTKEYNIVPEIKSCRQQCFVKSFTPRFRNMVADNVCDNVQFLVAAGKKCAKCNRAFSCKQSLDKHLKRCGIPRVEKFRVDPPYECALCGKWYDLRQNLVRHMHSHQPLESEYHQRFLINHYECAVCGKTYNRRHNLVRHIRIRKCMLPNSGSINMVKNNYCNECQKSFRSVAVFKRHLKSVHQISSTKPVANDRLRCVLCGTNFGRTDEVQHHLTNAHDVHLVHQHLRFASIDEFRAWKLDMQKSTTSVFSKIRCQTGASADDANVTWYKCHRSGAYTPRVQRRHRRIKLQGSMKMGGYCPAAITVFESRQTGRCRVSYVSTHVGHNVCDEAELAHMYPSAEEKAKLAGRLAEGVSCNRILTESADPLADSVYLLNKQSLFNISATYRIKAAPEQPTVLAPYDLESFVAEYHHSILFLKRAGEPHPSEPALHVDDAIAVVVTPQQQQLWRRFGGHVVAADCTFGANELALHALSVVDEWCEATPAALAVSNRNDRVFGELFVRAVRQRVGAVAPQTFVSEMGTAYYESWSRVMGAAPRFRLYCRWHVENAWRKNARKIADPVRRNEALQRLLAMSTCLDEEQFERDFRGLLADDRAQPFAQYLREEFADNRQSWAYCYRVNAGLNNNFHLRAFDRCLKYFNGNFLKGATFEDFLSLLNEFLELQTKELTRKRIFGKRSAKLGNLRKRHDVVVKSREAMSVDRVDDQCLGWLVSVGEDDPESCSMYAVRPRKADCSGCKMVCEECDSCLHSYECTCRDYCIEFNMCVHIHKVCMYLKETAAEDAVVESQSHEDCGLDPTDGADVDMLDLSDGAENALYLSDGAEDVLDFSDGAEDALDLSDGAEDTLDSSDGAEDALDLSDGAEDALDLSDGMDKDLLDSNDCGDGTLKEDISDIQCSYRSNVPVVFEDEDYLVELQYQSDEDEASQSSFVELCEQIKMVDGDEVLKRIVRIT